MWTTSFAGLQSAFSVSAYDDKGRIIQSTNNDHLTTAFEYNLFGGLTATRDNENRIFNSAATHFPGEND